MSVRRQARAGDVAEVVTGVGGVPRSTLIGRCIEVWADPDAGMPTASAMHRFGQVRARWLRTANVPGREGWQLIPGGSPWSVKYLTYRGQAELVGRPVSDLVAERLRRGGGRLLSSWICARRPRVCSIPRRWRRFGEGCADGRAA